MADISFNDPQQARYLILGGGAAGFFGAIAVAHANPTARVTILEAGNEVLGKVKVSGGGRCNVTHACFEPRPLSKFYPRGEKALLGPFHTFCTGDTMGWFEDRGVPLKIEEDGRVFPVSNKSQSIINCLLQEAEAAGIELHTQQRVTQLYPPEEAGQAWKALTFKGDAYYGDKVLVATGSSKAVWAMLEHLGHTIIEPVPSLFTFNSTDPRLDGLPGVAVPRASVSILGTKLTAEGPLLITHWGLSGPAILRLSAWGARILHQLNYDFQLSINWIAASNPEAVADEMLSWKGRQGAKVVASAAAYHLPIRLWKRFLSAAGITETARWADLNKKQIRALAGEITAGNYQVKGKSTFKDEFVTAGGVDLDEVNFKTFESRIHPGLHFAGEVLDIDAITGGFNFQAAWTGSWLAAQGMAKNE